jgi:hypothetical protein
LTQKLLTPDCSENYRSACFIHSCNSERVLTDRLFPPVNLLLTHFFFVFVSIFNVLTNLAYQIVLWFEKTRTIAYLYGSLRSKFGKLWVSRGLHNNNKKSFLSISYRFAWKFNWRIYILFYLCVLFFLFLFHFYQFILICCRWLYCLCNRVKIHNKNAFK